MYENWQAFIRGEALGATYEYPLFSDATIIGNDLREQGPYTLLNTVAPASVGGVPPRPSIILRFADYGAPSSGRRIAETDERRYHGGTLADEVTALLSLSVGVRLRCGGFTRIFEHDKDPLGWPVAWDSRPDPIVQVPPQRAVLPRAVGDHMLHLPDCFTRFCTVSPEDAMAVIRAARLYQEGLWVAESAPELAWLLFVSALETGASSWARQDPPVERLRAESIGPKLEEILLRIGGARHVEEVAHVLVEVLGSTKKFMSFMRDHGPEAPPDRPPTFYQHPWSEEALQKSLRTIYGYRSRALHGGTPFPLPMCDPPRPTEPEGCWSEKPWALGQSALGGSWVGDDVPMLLHTFEYIVRETLVHWWGSLAIAAGPASDASAAT